MARRPEPDRPRRVAFDLLRAVDERDAYANLLMPSLLRDAGLTDRDAGFATELAYGTLRMQGQHDYILAQVVDRPIADLDPPLLTLLRLGIHQLHQMRVPHHAAVAATVELARAVVGESRASLVNAVLRKVSTRTLDDWLSDAPESARYSHPQWIIDAFAMALGSSQRLVDVLEADNTPAAVTLAVRDEQLRPTLIERGAQPGRWSPWALSWKGALNLPALGSAALGVQDEGSQWVTMALTEVEIPRDRRWLDMCAGPGGKAALLSLIAERRDQAIELIANEIAPHRADLVRAQVRANTEVMIGDATTLQERITTGFDRILLDAPCSGIGALRRRPEARWRRTARDIGSLRPLQGHLLRAGLDLLNPGGVLAYVTCSPHTAETIQIVDAGVKGRSDVKVIPVADVIEVPPGAERGPYVQLWPDLHGTDGMFLALIQREDQ